tara:strand:- start:582 stop:959 length:378 start_codon:yes stop_codon:yes gene_type:complete
MDNDKFFELYEINIACYYNSKKLLKIINDESTNISPTVSEMLKMYETNGDRIKKNDKAVYDKHYKLVKKILCKLFSGKEEKSLFLGHVDSYIKYIFNSVFDTTTNVEDNEYNVFLEKVAQQIFID